MVFRINDFSFLIKFILEFYSNLDRLFLYENLIVLLILFVSVWSQKLDDFNKIKKFANNTSFYLILPFIIIIILTGLGINAGTSEKFIYFEF